MQLIIWQFAGVEYTNDNNIGKKLTVAVVGANFSGRERVRGIWISSFYRLDYYLQVQRIQKDGKLFSIQTDSRVCKKKKRKKPNCYVSDSTALTLHVDVNDIEIREKIVSHRVLRTYTQKSA